MSASTATEAAVVPAILDQRPALPARESWRLPNSVAFYLQLSIAVVFLAGSSAPTPLYSVYQAEWGFSPITVTVVFGIYALAVLSALLTVGSLSDHIGRRPVLIAAIVVQAAAMLIFASADGVTALLLARIVQGLSTGAAVGAIGAGLLDLHRTRGTIANGVGPILGTATGAIGSGLLVQYLPAPTHLVYLAIFSVIVLQGLGVLLMRESSTRKPGAIASLCPEFALPPAVRRQMLLAAPVLVAVWSLGGLYGSLGPTLVRLVVGSNAVVLGGLALAVLAFSGAATILALQTTQPRTVMLLGTSSLIVGVAITLVAISSNSTVGFFAGTAVAGVGFGAGFQGALRTVMPLAAPHERAGVLSTIYVISYLALGLPAVIAGFLVVHGGGVRTTAREYGVAVMVLATLALLGSLRSFRPARDQASAS
ncbi:MFS transporter [Jatrophihabitans sp. DSM 45814]